MKWYRYGAILGIMSICLGFTLQNRAKLTLSVSRKLNFQEKLNFSLKNNHLILTKDPECNDDLELCRLSIRSTGQPLTALISTQDDPYFQVASLQKILKIVTMNGKHADFIDLSSRRPYATLKDY